MQIIEKSKIWFGLSTAIIILGLIIALISGLNLGIDFTGGTMIQINLNKFVSVDEVDDVIAPFALNADIVHIGEENNEIIIRTTQALDNSQRQEIFSVFQEKYNLTDDDFVQAEQFGPAIGREIQKRALISILISTLCILIYVSFRFELKFGIAAIIALVHDVLVVLAIFSIFRLTVNSSFVAAMLTIVGYSINDTIVVFDRIRENIKFLKKKNYNELASISIEQTMARTINTSLTTLLTITALYILGVESIRQFSLPLIAGILVGSYSSIFIASPIWVLWKNWEKNRTGYNAS